MRLKPPKPAQPTFFYERKDGSWFACLEKEADLIKGSYKFLGSSDGTTFRNAMQKLFMDQDEMTEDQIKAGIRNAEKAELEAARGNLKKPRDMRNVTEATGLSPAKGIEDMINL